MYWCVKNEVLKLKDGEKSYYRIFLIGKIKKFNSNLDKTNAHRV